MAVKTLNGMDSIDKMIPCNFMHPEGVQRRM
jgi:hypothetical protein